MEYAIDLVFWPCTLLLCICSFLFFANAKKKSSNLPPGPIGLPLVGSIFALGKKPNESLRVLSKRYGPLMTLRLGTRVTMVVSSARVAEEALMKHDLAFAGRTVFDAVKALDHSKHSMVWNQIGPKWKELRRICNTQMLSTKCVDGMRSVREKKVGAVLCHIRAAAADGRAVDIGRCAFMAMLNLISNTFFSEDVADLESKSAQEFQDVVLGIAKILGEPNLSDCFPVLSLIDPFGMRRNMTVYFRWMLDLFDEIIEKRLESYSCAESAMRNDFLDVLLQQSRESGSVFSRDVIKSLLLDFFVAGSETSSFTTECAMVELLRHPEKMAALRAEFREVVGEGRLVEEDHIPHLSYLQAVVNETLRLHPPVPLLLPHRTEETRQVCGFTIPKQSQVIVNAWAIGRDEEVWKDPSLFMPERFIGSAVNSRGQDLQFIPFGAGRRICPGRPLALRMAHLMVASFVHSFSWTLPDGTTPEQLNVPDRFDLTPQKAVPLTAIPHVLW